MKILVNQQEVKTSIFPGGEVHVDISGIHLSGITTITTNLRSSDAIMVLVMTVDAIRREKCTTDIHLEIPYFPYARQDRVCHKGEAFSIVAMTNIINGLKCESVQICDPHSQMCVSLLNNVKVITQETIIMDSKLIYDIRKKNMMPVAPDAGATQKVGGLASRLQIPMLQCYKHREDGEVRVDKPIVVKGQNYIVLDDICDGGRTFVSLAKELKAEGCGRLYLYVTHGIFSNGLHDLYKYYDHIYCYNSLLLSPEFTDTQGRLTVWRKL